MIMVRAPFRISFAGGGSDFSNFYSRNGYGAVVSSAIDKYMYIMIHSYFHNKIRIKYSRTEDVNKVSGIQHPIVRACLNAVGIEKGIEIASIADVPAGTGLGSSSTFTVCLLHALYAYRRERVTPDKLAKEACRIEINVLNEPIGKQDQYASSFGGLNYIQFDKSENVSVVKIKCHPEVLNRLEKNLLMFYLGKERKAGQILAEQNENIRIAEVYSSIQKLVSLAEALKNSLEKGLLKDFGKILDTGWDLKKKLATGISNSQIDNYYNKARRAGASGGKLLGAGGCGFLLFYCEPKYQDSVRNALKLRELKFKFECKGSEVIFTNTLIK